VAELGHARVADHAAAHAGHAAHAAAQAEPEPLACGCPGSMSEVLGPPAAASAAVGAPAAAHSTRAAQVAPTSELRNWPVQIHLLPAQAPYYQGADLLLAADCVPFAHAAFHSDLLCGRTLAIGCPKLDDAIFYVEKLANILSANDIRSLTVAHMEVPCCFGLERVAAQAVARSGKQIPIETVIVGRDGTIKSASNRDSACPHA